MYTYIPHDKLHDHDTVHIFNLPAIDNLTSLFKYFNVFESVTTTHSADTMATCSQKHALVKFSKKDLIAELSGYSSGYICDKCNSEYIGTSYHCSKCEYDLCFKCYRETEKYHLIYENLLNEKQRKHFLQICKSLQS